jgi:pimeloyl-[acyl-carrier protein] synthase
MSAASSIGITPAVMNGNIFNPLDPDFTSNPYPRYELLREHEPVHRSDTGFWVVTRYDDVAAGLMDARLSNRPAPFAIVNPRNKDRHMAAAVASRLIAFLDTPEHNAPRKFLAKAFIAHIKGKEPLIANIAAQLQSDLGEGTVDFVNRFTIPFATRCICELMGFPVSDAARLKYWSGMFFFLFHTIPNAAALEQINEALAQFRAYVSQQLELRRADPRDDMLTLLLQSVDPDAPLAGEDLVDNIMLLTADGIENVHTGLASAVAIMLQHRDQLQLAIENPELFGPAVDECLRYESPGQYQGRIARETMEIGGKTIKANSVVLLVLASANRDPRAFPDPDRFVIERKGRRHLAFGLGRHACIGGGLISMEFRAFFEAFLDRWNRVELGQQELSWTARAGHRWPEGLTLKISPK